LPGPARRRSKDAPADTNPRNDHADRALSHRRQLVLRGSKDLASYLIVTPKGNILINSSTESSVPLIKGAIEQLGFKYGDTKCC